MTLRIFGYTIAEIIIILFVMPPLKRVLVDSLCELGVLECITSWIGLFIIPSIPIILWFFSRSN